MEPVKSNVNSRKCGNPIGSDGIIFQGNIPCLQLCGEPSITDVIQGIGNLACNQFNAYAPGNGLTVGQWINFTSQIPASGSGTGYSWITNSIGSGGTGNPSYKFTSSGDLLVRGSMG